jgi:hypothetical protein
MIRDVEFDTGPIEPGEARTIDITADGEVQIEIWCYREPPTPGKFVVCGRLRMPATGSRVLTPSPTHFQGAAVGRWRVDVTDISDGDTRSFKLAVVATSSSPNSAPTAGAGA